MVSLNTTVVQFECIVHICEFCILDVKALSSDKALLFIKMFHKSSLWEQQTSPHQSQIPFRAWFGMHALFNLKYKIASLWSVLKNPSECNILPLSLNGLWCFCVKIKAYTDPDALLWPNDFPCKSGGGFRAKEYSCLLLSLPYFAFSIGKHIFT